MGLVAVVGSRKLPASWESNVHGLVRHFTSLGHGVTSGGALGADHYALRAVMACGAEERSLMFLPGSLSQAPRAVARDLARYKDRGGAIIRGPAAAFEHPTPDLYIAALKARTVSMVLASSIVFAFLWGESRGTWFTCRQAVLLRKRLAVFTVRPEELHTIGCGTWHEHSTWDHAYIWSPSVPYGTRCRHGIPVESCAAHRTRTEHPYWNFGSDPVDSVHPSQ